MGNQMADQIAANRGAKGSNKTASASQEKKTLTNGPWAARQGSQGMPGDELLDNVPADLLLR